jgi:hypothetical protein
VAATKVKEWTLARTATKSKKEENIMVVRKSSETHKFSFQALALARVFVCSRRPPS